MTITNRDGMLEAIALEAEKLLLNIAKQYNAYHDSVSSAYSLSIPAGLLKWFGIKKIGGKTLAWNQLVDTGTLSVDTTSGHKYYTLIDGTESIITSDGTAITVVDDVADMVCDLTLMFGSGNEPATTSAFKAMFSGEHYPYDPGSLLSAAVTSVISKDSANEEMDSYSIPPEVQALTGYGLSLKSTFNYIDFDKKTFVQNVGSVDLGTLSWTLSSSRFVAEFPSDSESTAYAGRDGLCARYLQYSGAPPGFTSSDKKFLLNSSYIGGKRLNVTDSDYEDADAFAESVSGVYFNYLLAEPVETDISEYLNDFTGIDVEAGGSLEFSNVHGDDYKIPVYNEVEYISV